MRRILPIIAVLLAYAMMPGALEMTENALHLLEHGDTAHADADHVEDGEADEHGCSGTYHACTCHSSPHFVDSSVAPSVTASIPSSRSAALVTSALLDSGIVFGIDRPPQA